MFLLKNQSIQLKSMALLQTVDGSLSELAIPITQHPPPTPRSGVARISGTHLPVDARISGHHQQADDFRFPFI